MLERFLEYIKENNLFSLRDKILLGFSGGPDSVALAYLLHKAGYNFALAHVNFHLRGEDADRDQQFSRNFARRYALEFFTTDFDTRQYARTYGLSIEEAARDLRYSWFEQLRSAHGFDYIATAHNADDNVETILFNLARGTGLRGLLGIPAKRGNIVRPLLFAFKDEILDFCRVNNLPFRIDQTNYQTQFTRNKIRHLIVPQFLQINPGFKNNVLRTSAILREVYDLTQEFVAHCQQEVVFIQGQDIYINKEKLLQCRHTRLFLFEFLSGYGFTPAQVDNVCEIIESQPGKVVKSVDYQLINDRQDLILTPIPPEENIEILIDRDAKEVEVNKVKIKFEILNITELDSLKQPPSVALLDYDKLDFPLKIRHWQQGDYFYPFGMRGRKKLSDFFAERKIPLHKKKQVLILESNGRIVWVMGYRPDNRFCITRDTKRVLKVIMEEK